MKKLIFCLAFLMVGAMSINAQACNKGEAAKCCAKKAAKTASVDTKVAAAMEEAVIAADADESIKKMVDPQSGKTSFFQKSVCPTSGTVSMNEVEYCTKSKAFTKVASASMERAEGEVNVKEGKAKCAKSGAKCCAGNKKAKIQE